MHGNHEERPYHIQTYRMKIWHGGEVYYEPEYPNILFAKDGEIYDFDGKRRLQSVAHTVEIKNIDF